VSYVVVPLSILDSDVPNQGTPIDAAAQNGNHAMVAGIVIVGTGHSNFINGANNRKDQVRHGFHGLFGKVQKILVVFGPGSRFIDFDHVVGVGDHVGRGEHSLVIVEATKMDNGIVRRQSVPAVRILERCKVRKKGQLKCCLKEKVNTGGIMDVHWQWRERTVHWEALCDCDKKAH
jgi:biotin carboxyl carrier protein